MKGDKRTQIRRGVKGALRVGIDILPEYGNCKDSLEEQNKAELSGADVALITKKDRYH